MHQAPSHYSGQMSILPYVLPVIVDYSVNIPQTTLILCHQSPYRGQPETPLHQGRSYNGGLRLRWSVSALDSQSLGSGLMLSIEVCLTILSSSPESPKILYNYNSSYGKHRYATLYTMINDHYIAWYSYVAKFTARLFIHLRYANSFAISSHTPHTTEVSIHNNHCYMKCDKMWGCVLV